MSTPQVIEGNQELTKLIGQEAGVSGWIDVTQDMINRFADITGDHQWIHVDVERAKKETPFGGTIAHGFLTVSLLSRMSAEAVHVKSDAKIRINYGFNKLRFVSPVPAGARIRGHFVPISVKEDEIIWQVTVEVEGREKPALVAEWLGKSY